MWFRQQPESAAIEFVRRQQKKWCHRQRVNHGTKLMSDAGLNISGYSRQKEEHDDKMQKNLVNAVADAMESNMQVAISIAILS